MNETSALVIMIAAILTSNILLTNFLGMCSFVACSGQIKTALGLGTAVTFVLTCTTIINYLIYYGVLVENAPLLSHDITHLSFIIFSQLFIFYFGVKIFLMFKQFYQFY